MSDIVARMEALDEKLEADILAVIKDYGVENAAWTLELKVLTDNLTTYTVTGKYPKKAEKK